MTKFLPFYLDNKSFITNQKCFIITGNNLGYLTAFLNSKIFKYTYYDNFPELQGGTRELSKVFFENVYIKEVSRDIDLLFNEKIEQIQLLKRQGHKSEHIENEVHALLYEIYGLSNKDISEIEFIENQ